jgi:excisionase family DNA binding protein
MGDAAETIEPLLTVEQAAALLNVKPRSVYAMIAEGRLKDAGLVRLSPRRVRFSRPELVAFLAGQGSARKRR